MAINNLYQQICQTEFSNKVALEYFSQKITYKKLWKEIDHVASKLSQYGIKKGDCISIALPNTASAVVLLYGANKIGAVCNLLHPLLPIYKLKKLATWTKSKLLFVSDVVANDYVDQLVGDFAVVVCRTEDYLVGFNKWVVKSKVAPKRKNTKECFTFSKLVKGKAPQVAVAGDKDDVAIIMHGGGTTGEEKAVMLTNGNFLTTAQSTIEVICGDHKEKQRCMLSAIPFFHAFGFGVCLHTMLANGIKVLLMPAYSSKEAVKHVSKGKINYMAGVPTLFDGLTRTKGFVTKGLKEVKYAFSGSDRLSQEIKERFDNAVKSVGGSATLDEGYGLTECCGVSCVNTRPNYKEGSFGKVFSNACAEVFVDGKKMPRNTLGEICISGEGLFAGYFDDQETTDKVVFVCDGKRWLKTGDKGIVDVDGYIYYKDRIKRIAKVSGITVFPIDVEKTIEQIDGVIKCEVTAISHPYKGTVLKALVEKSDEIQDEQLLSQIRKECRQKLSKWERPISYQIEKLSCTKKEKFDCEK